MVEISGDDALDQLDRFPHGRFLLVSRLGSGAHAMVMQGWDRQLKRHVACKLSFDRAAFGSMSTEIFDAVCVEQSTRAALLAAVAAGQLYTPLREARLLALVDHPNVVSVIDVGMIDDGVICLVMPYLDGGTLEGRELGGSWQAVLDVALQIGRGLAAIHEAGILHRDLKPNNILFDAAGRPHVADLGLACLIRDATAMADRVGTRTHMAPEVLTRGYQDVRDDLYAYCMIVYQMFYGRSPFATQADRERGRVVKSSRAIRLPRALDKILARGLAPTADARWPNIPALLRAMEAVREPALRVRPWAAAVGSVGLAASFAIGVAISAWPAQADECEAVTSELEPIWDRELQAELRGAFGTRKPGDGLQRWAERYVAVRASECEAAKQDDRPTGPSPCAASMRQRFDATSTRSSPRTCVAVWMPRPCSPSCPRPSTASITPTTQARRSAGCSSCARSTCKSARS